MHYAPIISLQALAQAGKDQTLPVAMQRAHEADSGTAETSAFQEPVWLQEMTAVLMAASYARCH